MSDPIRMRALAPELDAVIDDASFEPPPGMQDAVWSGLEAAIASASAGGAIGSGASTSSTASSAGSAAGSMTAMKVAAAGIASVAAIGGVVAVVAAGHGADVPPARVEAAHTAAVAAPAPVAAPPEEIPTVRVETLPEVPEPAPAAAPALHARPARAHSAAVATAPTADSEDRVALEVAGVLETRALVRRGDGEAALARLSALDARVPAGTTGSTMREERDSLRIEALVLAGRKAEAATEAAAFARKYPESPQLERVRKLTQSSP